MSVVSREVIAGRRQPKVALVVDAFPNEEVEEFRPFEPPVPEQFRVEWTDHYRVDVHVRAQLRDLAAAVGHEIPRMGIGGRHGPWPMVELLLPRLSGDPVVFESCELPGPIRRQRAAELFKRQIESDVAVKIAIRWIAGITFFCAPDLPARVPIAPEGGRPGGSEARRVDRVSRTRTAEHQPVRIEHKPTEVRFTQQFVEARNVSAFRQPDPARIASEGFAIMIARDKNLRPHRL